MRKTLLFSTMLIVMFSCVCCKNNTRKASRTTTTEAVATTPAEQVLSVKGKLVMGHEVRSFTASGDTTEYWIVDRSGQLMKDYEAAAGAAAKPYTAVYAELKVKDMGKSGEGFAADYAGVYEVVGITKVAPFEE